MEIWKDVIGFEGKYMISNTGKVKSLARFIAKGKRGQRYQSEMFLKPSISHVGYARVRIGPELITIHRLVAAHFLPNPDNKNIINHKDGVKLNNNADNLEWCTNTENQRHAWATGLKKALKGGKHPYSKTSDSERLAIIELYKSGKKMSAIAKQFGLTDEYVIKLLKRANVHVKKRRDVASQTERRRLWKQNYQREYRKRHYKAKFEDSMIEKYLTGIQDKAIMKKAN